MIYLITNIWCLVTQSVDEYSFYACKHFTWFMLWYTITLVKRLKTIFVGVVALHCQHHTECHNWKYSKLIKKETDKRIRAANSTILVDYDFFNTPATFLQYYFHSQQSMIFCQQFPALFESCSLLQVLLIAWKQCCNFQKTI